MTGKLTLILLFLSIATGVFIGKPEPAPIPNDDLVENLWEEKQVGHYLGYENCRKCHQMQVDKLITTAHFKSFETTHRSKKSKSYCKALGVRSIKRDARCIRCHYTPENSSRGVRSQSGISCESCHGPSQKWIQGHNDYGGLTITKAQETIAHRQHRVDSSIQKGMRHPSNLYLLARSCYECHLVDDAELVNITDHPPLSTDFNMVAWSQGAMRHNFLRTDNQSNAASKPERLQVMYVVDVLAKLEALLKSLSSSEPQSEHFEFMKHQYSTTATQLLNIARKVDNSIIDQAIEVLKQTPPTATSQQRFSASNKIKNLAFQFGKSEAAHKLEGIQDMLPTPDQYR